MRAGNLNNRVDFYAKVVSRDSYGASSDTWPLVTISTRGEVRYTGGGRTLSNEEKFYSKNVELTVRYRSDIVETMRVRIDGTNDLYSISFLEIIGRKEAVRMLLDKINDGLTGVFIDPPTDLVVTSIDTDEIGLEWVNNEDGDPVSIERSTDGNNFDEIARTIKDTDSYSDKDVIEGIRYFYRIRAFKYHDYSAYTSVDDAIANETGSLAIRGYWVGSQGEYDVLEPNENTLYIII